MQVETISRQNLSDATHAAETNNWRNQADPLGMTEENHEIKEKQTQSRPIEAQHHPAGTK